MNLFIQKHPPSPAPHDWGFVMAQESVLITQGSCPSVSFCDTGGSRVLLERAVESSSGGRKDVELGEGGRKANLLCVDAERKKT